MLPLMLDVARLRLMLIGNGAAAIRRRRLLEESGAVSLVVHADAPCDELIAAAGVRFQRGLPTPQSPTRISLETRPAAGSNAGRPCSQEASRAAY